MISSALMVLSVVTATVLGSAIYFRRYRMSRPPFGLINLRDALIGLVGLVALPYLYLSAPRWLVAGIIGLAVLAAVYFALEPVLPSRAIRWGVCAALVGGDLVLGLAGSTTSAGFLLVNNAVMLVVALGTANLWAQSGVRARDVAVLAAGLAAYDLVATWQFTVMFDLMLRLTQLPLVPMIAWNLAEPATALQLGLGDLLLVTLFPLVARKAFGVVAGTTAALVGIATVAVTVGLLATGLLGTTIPVMVFLGPLTVGQYVFWRRRGPERTTRQYLLAEPLTVSPGHDEGR
jgi:hypothetical protein